MSFTEIFGGTVIYPAQQSYLALSMSGNVELSWPIEQSVGGNVVADIIDVTASGAGFNIDLPDARQVSTGYTSLLNNVGANTVTVRNAGGGTIVSLTSGTAWEIYLTDNSTEAGTWRTFQYGASVSVADAAALAGSGLKAITTTLNQSMPTSLTAISYVIVEADRAKLIIWTGGSGTFTLPDPAVVGDDWFVGIRNSGSGDLTVTPAAGDIDGAASLTVTSGNSALVVTDGTDYYTVGLSSGGSGGSGFNYLSINVSGTGDYTLSGAELNRIGYNFTGTLTGNRNIIVPASSQEYWVTNSTSGAFDLFIKTAAQTPGVQILPGDSNILFCDGTEVKSAESSTVSFPIAINQGGTAATTAANARLNLGATTVGNSLFTAANAAAALSTIGAAAAATTITGGVGISGGGDLSANRTLSIDVQMPYKTSDTARTTTVVSLDPELVTTSLSAGTYLVVVWGAYNYAGGTQGFRWQFQGTATIRASNPADSSAAFSATGGWNGTAALRGLANYPGNGVITTTTAPGADSGFLVVARVTITSPGTLGFSWAQAAVSATAITLLGGTTMMVLRVA